MGPVSMRDNGDIFHRRQRQEAGEISGLALNRTT
jgi:hypothetical protein